MWIVYDYFTRLNLAEMGYRFSEDDLDCWEVEAFNIIKLSIEAHKSKELKRATRKR